jgi:hypothetical protein
VGNTFTCTWANSTCNNSLALTYEDSLFVILKSLRSQCPSLCFWSKQKMVLENEISLVMSLHLGPTTHYLSAWALHYHPSMKEGRLFCFVLYCSYEIHWTGMLQILFLVSLESSRWQGVHGFGSMTVGLAVQKFLNIEWFLHWKLN